MHTSRFVYTQINIFAILFNQPEIRLYLSFSDWFGTKPKPVSFQINRKIVNKIWFRVDLIRFRKYFSACTFTTYSSARESRNLFGKDVNPTLAWRGSFDPRFEILKLCYAFRQGKYYRGNANLHFWHTNYVFIFTKPEIDIKMEKNMNVNHF